MKFDKSGVINLLPSGSARLPLSVKNFRHSSANPVLCVIQDGDGVAIGHIDNFAQEGIGLHLKHQAQRQSNGPGLNFICSGADEIYRR
jgi:hypothetical protein